MAGTHGYTQQQLSGLGANFATGERQREAIPAHKQLHGTFQQFLCAIRGSVLIILNVPAIVQMERIALPVSALHIIQIYTNG